MDFSKGMKGCLCTEARGKEKLLFPSCPFSVTSSVLTFSPFRLFGAEGKAGRRWVNSATFIKRVAREGQEVTDGRSSRLVTKG